MGRANTRGDGDQDGGRDVRRRNWMDTGAGLGLDSRGGTGTADGV